MSENLDSIYISLYIYILNIRITNKQNKNQNFNMANKSVNKWSDHHSTLDDLTKTLIRSRIMATCEWSQDTFYRKMKSPAKLKVWEKKLIAFAYTKTVHEFFPERKLQAIPI